MQSDFAIAAKKGILDKPDTKITDFPFKNTWYELTVKRLIRYAADNGFDAVAIPKGSVPAKRYGQEIDIVLKLSVSLETVKKRIETNMPSIDNDHLSINMKTLNKVEELKKVASTVASTTT